MDQKKRLTRMLETFVDITLLWDKIQEDGTTEVDPKNRSILAVKMIWEKTVKLVYMRANINKRNTITPGMTKTKA